MTRVIRSTLACAALLGVTVVGATAAAQCTKDTDCKESRLCEQGRCVEPAKVVRPKVPPHPFDWQKVYLQVGGVLAPDTWHGSFDGGHVDVGIRGGVHVALYGVSTTTEHYGGYFSYVDFAGGSQLHVGLSMKEGKRRFTRVWLGGVVDLGAYFLLLPGGQRGYGVELFPRLELDVILGASSKTRAALFFAAGPMLVPYFHCSPAGMPGTGDDRWLVSIHLLFGVLFGS
jgi:hypothetical protein